MIRVIRVIWDRYREIRVVLLPISDPPSLCKALSSVFIGPHCPMQPWCNTRAPAAEPRMQLHHLGLPGCSLGNPSCLPALTCLLSAPSAQTPLQAPSYLPLTIQSPGRIRWWWYPSRSCTTLTGGWTTPHHHVWIWQHPGARTQGSPEMTTVAGQDQQGQSLYQWSKSAPDQHQSQLQTPPLSELAMPSQTTLRRSWGLVWRRRQVYRGRYMQTPVSILQLVPQIQWLWHSTLSLYVCIQGTMHGIKMTQCVLKGHARDMSLQGMTTQEARRRELGDQWLQLRYCGTFLLGGGWCYTPRTCDWHMVLWLIATHDSFVIQNDWLMQLIVRWLRYDS